MTGERSTECIAFIEKDSKNRTSKSPSLVYAPGALSVASQRATRRRRAATSRFRRDAVPRASAPGKSVVLLKMLRFPFERKGETCDARKTRQAGSLSYILSLQLRGCTHGTA